MATRKVLLIGWDAADWKVIQPLLEAGKMPNLQRLVTNGSRGQIATLHPPLSPMLWTSIATGKRPFKHGIHGFAEPTPDGRDVQPVTNLSRKSKALWNILNQNDLRSVVIGWWPSHPAEPINGVMVSDHYHRARGPLEEGWPLAPNAVHPPELAGKLAELRVHPDLLTPELVEPFIPLAREIDQDKDQRLSLFLRVLAECMSIHSAATWLLDNQAWDFFAVYYDAIDHFCHGFMRYHPPRQSWIGERDFELYHNVVAMAYQFHDQMLGALIEKAGRDTTIVLLSDHGFHPDHLRPASIPDIPAGPAIEHRDYGVLVISGPGINKNERLHGASVLDVAPTILTLYDLPAGEDMDGKVLSQAFAEARAPKFIPSWEDVAGADGRHPPYTRLDPVAAHEALEQMIALGYIERPDENRAIAVTKAIRELRYNLGEAYQDAGRHAEAHQIFSELCSADPAPSNGDVQRFAVRLFVSCQALGLHEEMRRIVDHLAHSPLTDLLKAQVLTAEQRYPEALAVLEPLAQTDLVRPGTLLQIADLYLRLHRWRDARQAYEKALAIDPDNAQAYLGLCQIALRRKEFSAAADSALAAIERTYHDPRAHFLLGHALARMKEFERAAEAFRAAIAMNPNFPEAHVRLAAILEERFDDAEGARTHRRLARRMKQTKPAIHPRSLVDKAPASPDLPITGVRKEMPPLSETLVVVTGLPRSGTSMLMQMLAAGGLSVLSDESRAADEDNPRGYLEFEPVKVLLSDSKWLLDARGNAVKIVVPLLVALPPDLACRVILCERDLDEVLDSQDRMLVRRNQPVATPERRQRLKDEYTRALDRAKVMLARRPGTQFLVVEQGAAIRDPLATARRIDRFLGGGFDTAKMADAIDPALHRNRAATRVVPWKRAPWTAWNKRRRQ
ncbi:MAG TPA: alkaline phosphatase family protein [Bryobacteraceae bacterium]|nr:alkaline phosphatase family protein [Bryobacteraceae bacterium]